MILFFKFYSKTHLSSEHLIIICPPPQCLIAHDQLTIYTYIIRIPPDHPYSTKEFLPSYMTLDYFILSLRLHDYNWHGLGLDPDYFMYMLKHCRECLRDIKHEARGRDANKARGEAECFINIEATRRVLYFV